MLRGAGSRGGFGSEELCCRQGGRDGFFLPPPVENSGSGTELGSGGCPGPLCWRQPPGRWWRRGRGGQRRDAGARSSPKGCPQHSSAGTSLGWGGRFRSLASRCLAAPSASSLATCSARRLRSLLLAVFIGGFFFLSSPASKGLTVGTEAGIDGA